MSNTMTYVFIFLNYTVLKWQENKICNCIGMLCNKKKSTSFIIMSCHNKICPTICGSKSVLKQKQHVLSTMYIFLPQLSITKNAS